MSPLPDITLPAAITLALDALAYRVNEEPLIACSIGVVATLVWWMALASSWLRAEQHRASEAMRARARHEERRAAGNLRTLDLPIGGESVEFVDARRAA